ncbi:MAG: phosphoglucosamine mutase [Deltaproteobacteria bacterium GWC2_42_11]|nr:MAG: phosphoglucosamine mutase [Deltaproteobacteria bacterium GWC2_42_11]HBO83672.1 phosphoglucosamine mutase [Deltaproteobacteria bacterium]
MASKRLFGTDGVRGVANVYPMTVEIATQLGRAIAYVFKKEPRRHKIVIGKDTRLSGYMLENAMVAGICSMGVDVMLVGPLPTPGIAFITSSMRADAGVVISASHNLYQDNGIKFFSRDGFKLPDKLEKEIEDFIFNNNEPSHRPTASDIGKAYRIDDAIGRYVVFAKNSFPKELTLNGLKIVVDCANGACYKVAPEVFYELGAEVISIGVGPNGENINQECGSLYPEVLAKIVKEKKADIGIAFDGDGDRVVLIDEKGNILDGDHIMAICAIRMIREKRLNKNTLVTTVMSNIGLDDAIKTAGGRTVKVAVGDRCVVEEMVRGRYNLGGEQSGHILFLDHTTTGDGIISALQVLSIMVKEQKKLSALSEVMQKFPQVLVNVKVREKRDFNKISPVAERIKDVENKLESSGRVFVRYSGTEPLARVMVEGKDEREIKEMADYIAEAIEKEIGVDG